MCCGTRPWPSWRPKRAEAPPRGAAGPGVSTPGPLPWPSSLKQPLNHPAGKQPWGLLSDPPPIPGARKPGGYSRQDERRGSEHRGPLEAVGMRGRFRALPPWVTRPASSAGLNVRDVRKGSAHCRFGSGVGVSQRGTKGPGCAERPAHCRFRRPSPSGELTPGMRGRFRALPVWIRRPGSSGEPGEPMGRDARRGPRIDAWVRRRGPTPRSAWSP